MKKTSLFAQNLAKNKEKVLQNNVFRIKVFKI